MRIGLDFDNTIVCYDRVFHQVALEWGLIPTKTPMSKWAVREFLCSQNQEDRWTDLQGMVYGSRLLDADPFAGVKHFVTSAQEADHIVCVVSHKTRYPYRGPKYDLHQVARAWLKEHIPNLRQIFFEETKKEKIIRIANFGCDVFVDDLPDILGHPYLPSRVQKILFDPNEQHVHAVYPQVTRVSSWAEVEEVCVTA